MLESRNKKKSTIKSSEILIEFKIRDSKRLNHSSIKQNKNEKIWRTKYNETMRITPNLIGNNKTWETKWDEIDGAKL